MSSRGGFEVYFWNSFREMLSDTDFTKKKVVHSPYSRQGNKILSGSIKQAQNAVNEFTFVIPMQNNLYQKLIPFQSIIQVVNLYDDEIEFEGRVLTVSNKMTSTGFVQEVVCEDFLSFLHDSTQHYQKLKNTGAEAYLREILSQHNAQVEDYKQIRLGTVTVKSLTDKPWRYLGYESTWDTIRERIVANIGGYLTLRRENDGFYLDWASSIGKNQDSPIQLGRNIKSASREISFDGIATQIMPIGADEKNSQNQSDDNEEEQGPDVTRKQIDISSVNSGKIWLEDAELVAKFGVIRKPIIWTEIDNPQVLKNSGLQYLRNQRIALAKWTVSAVERYLIDRRYVKFKIGNTHPILNAPLSGIERLQIIEKKIDVLNPQSVDLVIGSKSQSLSAYQLQFQEAIESIERVKANRGIESKREKLLTLTSELERLRNEHKPENTERIKALEAEIIKIRNELGGS